jgi:cytochrome c oxidase assembly factor CtaG
MHPLNSKVRALSIMGSVLMCATTTFAHGGKPHNWHDLWRSWSFEPLIVISLALTAFLFFVGLRSLWRESGKNRGIRKWEVMMFAGGWVALFVALVSPIHAWGRVLFSAHMTQHEVLMLFAAPLLVLGRPIIAFMWAIPMSWARQLGALTRLSWFAAVWRVITIPLFAWLIHAIALWVWHIPVLFDAVLNNELVHTLQHISFLFSAILFWWALIHGGRGWMGYGAAILYVFTTSLHSGLLGAFLTFSTTLWYPGYNGLTRSWGLTPIEDQQLGGLIMWIPAGLVYVIAGLALLAGWIREAERRASRRVELLVPGRELEAASTTSR